MIQTLSEEEYIDIMQQCVNAWNNNDAVATASYYSDDLEYRDPNMPDGITVKSSFITYLKILFRKWPQQQWSGKTILPHSRPGAFSVCYDFRFANKNKSIEGFGMDRIEFEGDKIKLNYVYLNAKNWKEWIRTI